MKAGAEAYAAGVRIWDWEFEIWDCRTSARSPPNPKSVPNPQSIVRRRRPVVAEVDGAEPVDGFLETFAERRGGLPLQVLLGQRDVGLAADRVVGGERLVDELRFRAGELDDQLGELADGEFDRVAQVARPWKSVRAVHHADDAFDQIVAVAEGAALLTVAVERDVVAGESLADEVRDHAAVERVHPRPVGVEDPHDADVDPVHAVIV